MVVQNLKPLHEFTPKHLRLAELLAEGTHTARDCFELAGFSRKSANAGGGKTWIARTRESSFYPHLWDYFAKCREDRIRLFSASNKNITDGLRAIAFASITDIVVIPRRRDLQDAAIKAAKVRKEFGYSTDEDAQYEALAAELAEDDLSADPDQPKRNYPEYLQYAPGASIKLKCIDEIPVEYRGAIAEISETKYGLKVRMHDKVTALDKLARINGMYTAERESKPVTIGEINFIVKGSKSKLLPGT